MPAGLPGFTAGGFGLATGDDVGVLRGAPGGLGGGDDVLRDDGDAAPFGGVRSGLADASGRWPPLVGVEDRVARELDDDCGAGVPPTGCSRRPRS